MTELCVEYRKFRKQPLFVQAGIAAAIALQLWFLWAVFQ